MKSFSKMIENASTSFSYWVMNSFIQSIKYLLRIYDEPNSGTGAGKSDLKDNTIK